MMLLSILSTIDLTSKRINEIKWLNDLHMLMISRIDKM